MRRSVPSWPKGGQWALELAPPWADRPGSAARPSAQPWPPCQPRPLRCAGRAPSRTGSGHPPRRAGWSAAPPRGREATDGLCCVPCRTPSLNDLERVGLQIDQDTQQPIFRHGQRTVLIGRVPTGAAWSSIEAPVGHMGLERHFKRRHQLFKLLHGETGQIEHLGRVVLEIGEPYSSHDAGLLSLEA
jgi:hypothetical protein